MEQISAKDRLLDTLCNDSKQELVNVKFCRGTDVGISEDAFCQEVNSALLDIETMRAKASTSFDEPTAQIVVKDFVAKHA